MKSFYFRPWSIALALLILCLISYGVMTLMASKLGFHWDDLTIIWYVHALGPTSLMGAVAANRALVGCIHVLTTSLLGDSMFAWQLFGVLTRGLLSIAFWWCLNALWPRHTMQITLVAVLFAVYPGFKQQFVVITWSIWFIVYTFFLLSLGAMLSAIRQAGLRFWRLYILSIILGAYVIFTVEYFFGLELLRPILLWIALSPSLADTRKRIKQVSLYWARLWAPYAIYTLIFLIYRIATPTPRGAITILDNLRAAPLMTVVELGKTVVQDILTSSLLAWVQTLDISAIFQAIFQYGTPAVVRYALLCLGAAGLLIFYLARLRQPHRQTTPAVGVTRRPANCLHGWGMQAILLSIPALLLGGIPVWATNLRMGLNFPWDRFTLAMMPGASLLLVGLLELVVRARWLRIAMAGILVGLAVGMHFQVALSYRQEWLMQKDFFWQMVWRAPGIQPGTTLLTTELPFTYNTDNSLSTALNWTYAPQHASLELAYLLYDVEGYYNYPGELANLRQSPAEIEAEIRTITFHGSTSQSILIFYTPPACLRIPDPVYDQHLPNRPRFFRQLLPLSNLELIQTGADPAAQPPLHILGPEPEHGWCYYFEKADLARQQGDWQLVVELGDRALAQGYNLHRKNMPELLPFIEGYARLGQLDRATQLSLQAYQTWENMQPSLCALWERLDQAKILQGQISFEDIQQKLGCASP